MTKNNSKLENSTLAPDETKWMYPDISDKVRQVIDYIGPCRDERCLVPKAHPYYHNEILDPTTQNDPAAVKTPLMPVVPSVLNTGKIMILGDYPTAKFTARSKDNQPVSFDSKAQNQFFVPIADIWAPMQNASYFDGYKPRFVASGTFFVENYLQSPTLTKADIKIDADTDIWTTNLIKCYLFHQNNVDAYRALGWDDVKVEETHTKMMPIAEVCWRRNLSREIEVCEPQIIITVGEPNCTVVQNIVDSSSQIQKDAYDTLQGVGLYAGKVANAEKLFPRTDPWIRYNIIHMLHPEAVLIAQTNAKSNDPQKKSDGLFILQKHQQNLESLAAFLKDLGWKG